MNRHERLITRLDEAVNSDCGDYSCPGHPSTRCIDGCQVEQHIKRLLSEAAALPRPLPTELKRLCRQGQQIVGERAADPEATALLTLLFGEENVR